MARPGSVAESRPVARNAAHHITSERSQLTALRRVARGTVFRGPNANEFVDGERILPGWMVNGLQQAVQAGYVVFSAAADPARLSQRAELTVGGFTRVTELAHRLDQQ